MAGKPELRETTQTFMLSGSDIQAALGNRAKQHDEETKKCLTKISKIFTDKADGDYGRLAQIATAAMLALVQNVHLASDAIEVKAQLERAAYLTQERLDLLCIQRNLTGSVFYKVSLEEAKRYGLV